MQIYVKDFNGTAVSLMRKIGYVFQKQENSHELAFVRTLAQSGFPRFHIYVKKKDKELLLTIHLDQHKETYGQETLHHGEYACDGALGEEMKRIQHILQK
ncbi:MAG: hypothetical protein IPN70_02305 [Candidatus Moraniibacteriota bacterium]|nr:MAG: hypothetical protein IPN70_02305 [Candidatus Moranbacteria bacterium]